MKLGLLDEKAVTPYDSISLLDADTKEMKELNLQVALKSLVLLKNENNLLPLDKNKYKTIGIIGPNANNRKALVGNYEGTSSEYVTVLEGVRNLVGEDTRILYSEGCHLYKDRIENLGIANDRIAEVKGICEHSDIVICCMGLDAGLEGEEGDEGNQYASGDKPNLNLPGIQQQVLDIVSASGKPVVLVLLSGSALAINQAEQEIPAILYAGYPGAQGGNAVAKILFGEYSPEGKLPITFYRSTEELPEFTDYAMKNRTYRYMTQEALYPFGFGLSYSKFALQDVTLSSTQVGKGDVTVECTVANTGDFDAAQTVQVYVKVNQADTPNAQLKGLKKVFLRKGEAKKVTLTLTEEAFGLFNEEAKKMLYAGDYTVYVGTSQPDARSAALLNETSQSFTLTCEETRVIK